MRDNNDHQEIAQLLARRLEASGQPRETAVTVAELHRVLLPYPECRDALGFATKAEYDLALLRFLRAGRYVRIDEGQLAEAVERELSSPEPGLAFLKHYAAAQLRVHPPAFPGASSAEESTSGEVAEPPAEAWLEELDEMHEASGGGENGRSMETWLPEESGEEVEASNPPGTEATRDAGTTEATRDPAAAESPDASCRSCGTDLPPRPGIRFCPRCGTDQRVRRCGRCGEELEGGWDYCPRCGSAAEGT